MFLTQPQDFADISKVLAVPERVLKIKWVKLVRCHLKRLPWSAQEDRKILQFMEADLASKWTEIALLMFEDGTSPALRTAKQIRERWVNYIDPRLSREDWALEEDHQLLQFIAQLGKRWCELGKHLSRSENSVKNRYYSLVLRQKRLAKNGWKSSQQDASNSSLELGLNFQPNTATCSGSNRICGFRDIVHGEPYNTI